MTNSPWRIKAKTIPSPAEMQAPERIAIAFNGRGMECWVCVTWIEMLGVRVGMKKRMKNDKEGVNREEGVEGWVFCPFNHL